MDSLLKKLDEINNILKETKDLPKQAGLLSGMAGIILFQFYYAKFKNDDELANLALNNLENCIQGIGKTHKMTTYCSGVAGLGWLIDHLEVEGFIFQNNDNLFSELDDFFSERMISNLETNNYDFLHGAIGYAFYFLKRYESTKSDKLKFFYKEKLLLFISRLGDLSQRDKTGIKWKTPESIGSNKMCYNYSLSHGASSIINLLSRLNIYKEFEILTAPLLRGTVNHFSSMVAGDSSSYSLYPSKTSLQDNNILYNSRLAWCYGDLGVAISLWWASKSLNDSEIGKLTLKIFRHSTKRQRFNETLVLDAMICHGSFGIAQIYNRMFSETNLPFFKDSAKYWIEDGIRKAAHEDGYAGYKMWQGSDSKWEKSLTLLDGIAGIGLSLLSYLTNNNAWDESLMIG